MVMKRPDKRNSMIAKFWDELPELVKEIDSNAKARVIVISSTGPHFTSGLDISLFSDLKNSGSLTEYERNIQAQSNLIIKLSDYN